MGLLLLFKPASPVTYSFPSVQSIDDWSIDLCNSSGVPICPLTWYTKSGKTTGLVSLEATAVEGATAHRLEGGSLELMTQSVETQYLDFDAIQFIRMVPYNLENQALWGVIGKPTWGYNPRGRWDTIRLSFVGVEYLLHSRMVYYWNGTTMAGIGVSAGKADDLAKKIVRYTSGALCGNDVDGNSRAWNWGTLAVAADTGSCPDNITLSYFDKYVDDTIQAIAEKYSFGWELRPSVAGGAVTFTFTTAYPRGGTDRTVDNGAVVPVIINDYGAMVPSAKRFRDWFGMYSAVHGPSFATVGIDAARIATWGRWEGKVQEATDAELVVALANNDIQDGYEWEYEAQGAGESCRWLEDWYVGDLVTHANTRLGITAGDGKVAGVTFSFEGPRGLLRTKIRWGGKEPTISQRATSGGRRSGSGRPHPPDPTYPVYVTPSIGFAASAAEGSAITMIRGDATIKLVFAGDAGTAVPTVYSGNTLTIAGGGGITTSAAGSTVTITGAGIGSPGTLTVSTTNLVAGGIHYHAITTSSNPGAAASILASDASGYLTLQRLVIAASGMDVTGATKFLGSNVNLYSGADLYVFSDAGTTTELHIDGATGTLTTYGGALYVTGTVSNWTVTTAGNYMIMDRAGACYFQASNGSGYLSLGGGGSVHILQVYAAGLTISAAGVQAAAGAGVALNIRDGNLVLTDAASTTKFGGGTYTWPAADAAGVLTSSGAGVLSWVAAPPPAAHNVTGASHGDAATASVAVGDLLYGNATPKWDRLARSVPAAGTLNYLSLNNGDTIPSWRSASNTTGAAAAILATDSSGVLSIARYVSTVVTGTAPLTVASTTACTNLNADYTDGFHAQSATAATTIVVRDASQIIYAAQGDFNVATGTAPLTVASVTNCTNLNADLADGFHSSHGLTFGALVARDGGDGHIHVGAIECYTTLPAADNTYNLGSGALEWANIYAQTGIYANGVNLVGHHHHYDQPTSPTGNASATHTHTFYGNNLAQTGNQVDAGGGNHYHVYTAPSDSGVKTNDYTTSSESANHNHAITINAATNTDGPA